MKNKEIQIQVLGSGCPTCGKLFELTKQAVNELDLNTEVEYVTDIQKIVQLGLMSSPVLTVNNQPVAVGVVPNIEKIKKLITDNI